jgi:hypothetical protein
MGKTTPEHTYIHTYLHTYIHHTTQFHIPEDRNLNFDDLLENMLHYLINLSSSFFQPEGLTVIVEISNIVFSAIFAVEMMLKIIAEGPFSYVSNGFNVFDGVIVVLR